MARTTAIEEWTTANIPSLAGRHFIITGANSGIGYQTAMVLAVRGAQVTLACRDETRGNAAASAIRRKAVNADVTVAQLDLASLLSVKSFAETVLSSGQDLHCLINNAGVMAPPKRLETKDGFELQFGTNVLGHFALTALLMPALERAEAANYEKVTGVAHKSTARVVTVASIAHKRGRIDFDNLQSKRGYSPMASYAQSKLADLMFAFELDRRLRAAGSNVLSVAVHPGVASTNLFRNGDYHGIEKIVRDALGPVIGAVLNTDRAGALSSLYAATADTVEGGGYYGPQGLFEARGKRIGKAKVAAQARDGAVASRLWQDCENLSGIKF